MLIDIIMRKISILVSINLSQKPGMSIWSNGAVQHSFFFYQLLKQLPYVNRVYLGHDSRKTLDSKWLLNEISADLFPIEDVISEVDLLVELSAAVSEKQVSMVRDRGGRFISYRVGNDLVLTSEALLFNAHRSWFPNPNGLQADAIWANPQFIDTCASLWEQLYGSKVAVLPHLWSPYFLNLALQDNPLSAAGWPYSGNSDNLKLSIFEPNISVVKNVIIPFYICSEFYKNNKDKINKIRMYNTLKLKDSSTFNRIVMGTDAGKESVATAEGRFSFPDAMGQEGGIIVSHQWENGLNYVYYEALYGGFPLVHNSPFLKDVGYYYEGFDINDGVKALERAVLEHDEMRDEYDKRAEAFLKTVDPSQKSVIDAYDREIRRLFS
jgi:hypothetical protein